MKKIILTIATAFLFMGCQKEQPIEVQKNCECGVISNDGITNGCYWLEVRNDCSSNKKKFCFDQDVWLNNFVGNKICVTNETW